MVLETLIVDDEPVARRILREELEQIDDIALIGEADDGAFGAWRRSAICPRIWFFWICRCLGWEDSTSSGKLQPGERIPMIVIVTAWDQYAIQAFEAGAIDYLLKPIGQERLAQAVDRAMKLREPAAEVAQQFANVKEIAEASAAAPPAQDCGEERRRISAAECRRSSGFRS